MNPVKSKATVAAVTYMWVCGWGLWQWDVWVGCIWTLRCGRLHTHTAVFLCLFFSLVYSAVPGSQCLWAWAGVNGWGLGELASSSSTIISLRRILLCDDINLFNYPASGGFVFFCIFSDERSEVFRFRFHTCRCQRLYLNLYFRSPWTHGVLDLWEVKPRTVRSSHRLYRQVRK